MYLVDGQLEPEERRRAAELFLGDDAVLVDVEELEELDDARRVLDERFVQLPRFEPARSVVVEAGRDRSCGGESGLGPAVTGRSMALGRSLKTNLRHHRLPRLELEALHVRDDLLEPLARH